MWEWIIRIMKKIRFWILHSTKIINGTLTGRIDNVRAGKVYGFNSFPFLCHLCNNLRNGVCCIVYGRVCGGNDHFIIYCIFFFQPETGSISGNVGSILWTPICIYTYILFQNERHVDMNICICTIYISVWTAKNLIFTALVDFYIFVFFSLIFLFTKREKQNPRAWITSFSHRSIRMGNQMILKKKYHTLSFAWRLSTQTRMWLLFLRFFRGKFDGFASCADVNVFIPDPKSSKCIPILFLFRLKFGKMLGRK